MLFPNDFFSQETIKHKFVLIINKKKVRMCHRSLKAHILGDSNTLKLKQYLIMHNVILLDAICGVLEQSDGPLGSKEGERDNVLQLTICLERILT
jgi:hypothetical protein